LSRQRRAHPPVGQSQNARSTGHSGQIAGLLEPRLRGLTGRYGLLSGGRRERSRAQRQQQVTAPLVVWFKQVQGRLVVGNRFPGSRGSQGLLSRAPGVIYAAGVVVAAGEVNGQLGQALRALLGRARLQRQANLSV